MGLANALCLCMCLHLERHSATQRLRNSTIDLIGAAARECRGHEIGDAPNEHASEGCLLVPPPLRHSASAAQAGSPSGNALQPCRQIGSTRFRGAIADSDTSERAVPIAQGLVEIRAHRKKESLKTPSA